MISRSDAENMIDVAFNQPRSDDVGAREVNFTRGDVTFGIREEYKK